MGIEKTKGMKIGEKIEAIENILGCPKCRRNTSGDSWKFKEKIAICPWCQAEIHIDNVVLVRQIKTTLERLS